MKRIYTEIRIHHQSTEEKEQFERQLDDKVKASGFSSRAEYIRVVALNANIRVATNAGRSVCEMMNLKEKLYEKEMVRMLAFKSNDNLYCYFEDADGKAYRDIMSPAQLKSKLESGDIKRCIVDNTEIEYMKYDEEKKTYFAE